MSKYLEVFVGPMFSGKTSILFEKIAIANSINKTKEINSLYICHSLDDQREFTSHSSATNFKVSKEKCKIVKTDNLLHFNEQFFIDNKIELVCIDEAQFFDGVELYNLILNLLKKESVVDEIYVAGLDGNYEQKVFQNSGIHLLIPLSDKFKKLRSSICIDCFQIDNIKTVASFTSIKKEIKDKLDENGILIGGAESWKSVCRNHL